MSGRLIVFAGLPGTGKSTLARMLAEALPAFLIRIDTIEQAFLSNPDGATNAGALGYVIAYRVAADNLRLGASVMADCVNPRQVTREAWREVAKAENVPIFNIEVVCSDAVEHRRRVETRTADIEHLLLPTWEDVVAREYVPWIDKRTVIDTAHISPDDALQKLLGSLQSGNSTYR
jgi:predicted kinase